MILFKTDEERTEFVKLDIRVKAILYMIAAMGWERKEYRTVVTDCLRTTEEDKKFGGVGIHPTGRALDFNFQDKNGNRIHDPIFTGQLMDEINRLLPYGHKEFKTLIYHDVGHGNHFHLQVNSLGTTCLVKYDK